MTVQTVIEKLMSIFPQATEALIVKELDVAQRRFAGRTRLLTAVGDLSDITTYISFTLPDDFKTLKGIYYYDSDEDPIYEANMTITGEVHDVNGTKKLTFRSTNTTPITALPTDIAYIQIEYYKYPTALTARSSTLTIGEEYWAALEKMVMIELFKMYPRKVSVNDRVYNSIDWRGISTMEREVKDYEREARVERNVEGDDRDYDIKYYDHAGGHYELQRSRVTGTTIQIEGGDVAYTKYYRILVDDDGTSSVGEKSGFGTINVAIDENAPSIVITSPSNEFSADPATWVWSNQGIGYSYDNAGQITFTPHSTSWGSVEIEIYIY